MAIPPTRNGYNLYDMLSMMQKAIRRNDYNHAGFAVNELVNSYRTAMWNRIMVISAEDCFGVITKEIVNLRKQDELNRNNDFPKRAVWLLCNCLKSRDACYFACNFVLCTRKPRTIKLEQNEVEAFYNRVLKKDDCFQMDFFEDPISKEDLLKSGKGVSLQKSIEELDMDMIGYQIDTMRKNDREYLWQIFFDFCKQKCPHLENELKSLYEADCYVNGKKTDKDEIFISKAVINLCYAVDERIDDLLAIKGMEYDSLLVWKIDNIPAVDTCRLENGVIPEWVFDCHTMKGKKMGKTDWDMTTTEGLALNPLKKAYFEDASWLYAYQWDFDHNLISKELFDVILEYAKTHKANPIEKE